MSAETADYRCLCGGELARLVDPAPGVRAFRCSACGERTHEVPPEFFEVAPRPADVAAEERERSAEVEV